MFLKKLLKKFVAHIFTHRLAPYAPKSVNYSRHSESLKCVWKSKNRCYRKIFSISEFFQMFNSALCRELLTDLDAKYAKRSLKM